MSWTDIPDSVLEPNKPIRSVDGLALRDNPIAIANGEPGAPKIQNAAYAGGSITSDKFDVASIEGWIWFDRPAGGIGTMGLFSYESFGATAILFGQTVAGSTLNPSGAQFDNLDNITGISGTGFPESIAGTWRCLGMASSGGTGAGGSVSLFQRIA